MRQMNPWALVRYVFCHVFCPCHEPQLPHVEVTMQVGGFSITFNGAFEMDLPDDKTATASATFTDAKGNPAKVDGNPTWSTDKPDVLNVIDNGDGTATIEPLTLGTAQVKCTADADLGSGTTDLVLLGDVNVIAGQAVAGQVNIVINP